MYLYIVYLVGKIAGEQRIYILDIYFPHMLDFAAVVPHGDELIAPEPGLLELHNAMLELGRMADSTELYVLITPHNIRIDTHIGVILTEYLAGSWRSGAKNIRRTLRSDRALAKRIYERARAEDIPVVGINFGALEGKYSRMPLDWGSLIPLYFMPRKKTVLLTPARNIPRNALVRFGELLGAIIKEDSRKIGVIVSADQAHTHSATGPYGYSEYAEKYDKQILDILSKGHFDELLEISEDTIERAMPDSYWQLLILAGIGRIIKLDPVNVAYGIADYFGMAVAHFTPYL